MSTAKKDKNQKVNKKKSGKKTPTPRGVRLKQPRDCIKLINRLVNEVLTGNADESMAAQNKLRTISYSLTVLLKAFEISELSERVKKIEEFIECQSKHESAK